MSRVSAPGLLVLHAIRLLGFADMPAVARRFVLEPDSVAPLVESARTSGWVTHSAFAGLAGWSLTEAGRQENQRQLTAELAVVDGAAEIRSVHRSFLPLNHLLQQACTDWQLRPGPGDPLAVNDHADADWDAGVLDELTAIARGLAPLAERLAAVLSRFDGYHERFVGALQRARAGRPDWVDGTDVDSCHRVWFELHEDLIATLGVNRGSES